MSLSMKRTVGAVATAPSFCRTPRMAVLTRAKEQPTIDPVGYINNDNSGKGNMFPTIAKPFVSSPNTSELASSGLGGLQGESMHWSSATARHLADQSDTHRPFTVPHLHRAC